MNKNECLKVLYTQNLAQKKNMVFTVLHVKEVDPARMTIAAVTGIMGTYFFLLPAISVGCPDAAEKPRDHMEREQPVVDFRNELQD
ncbi:hypothetical protein ACH6EH_19775 [Paenibacillus sp. JSM ZJ436]|uniref:hypothetical protein n=1 Tax=Paenibacillus sp. JSM ZJ436 TaxID=3376190 RepID=UPI00378C0B74